MYNTGCVKYNTGCVSLVESENVYFLNELQLDSTKIYYVYIIYASTEAYPIDQ